LGMGRAAAVPQASFEERLGQDDGAALAILFGANLRGNLELCDCMYPRGGLARRVGYIEGFKRRFKDIPVIQVEVGSLFYNSADSPQDLLRNQQVARAYSIWPVDVINLSRFDLIYARKLLARDGLSERIAMLPMIKNIISANGVFGPEAVVPPPYLIKEVSGPRINRGVLRIGFIGLAGPIKVAEGIDATVRDVFKSARRLVPAVRSKCDVLVLLVHAEYETGLRLARENPQADVVIVGNPENVFEPRRVGKTLVVCAAPGNTQEGDLRLYISADGKISFKFRSVNLDSAIPADPEAAAFVDQVRRALSWH
jgi:2',3'-cyclic-nucleotide 2'-phosphodiesterase (5'-nucleotidase family)